MVSVSDFDPKKMLAFMSDCITGEYDFSSLRKPVSGGIKSVFFAVFLAIAIFGLRHYN